MKAKVIFGAIIVYVLFLGTANAQITPTTREISLTGNDRAILDKRISNYTAFTIDKKELADKLFSSGSKEQFRLRVDDDLDWVIDLELNDMRAPDYRATYTTNEGTFEVKEPFVVNTFKGRTSDGKIARFTIDENMFFGVILGDNYHYVIRSASDYTENREDKSYIVYKSYDIIPDDDHFDYIDDALKDPESGKNIAVNTGKSSQVFTKSSSSCPGYYLEIATDADFEFHQARGGSSGSSDAPARNHILSVLNTIEGVYESTFGLIFRITFQHVYTTNAQPYTSTDASTLLNQFRVHWDTHHAEPRDIAHLFTGKNLDKSIVGLAYLGELHDPLTLTERAYALSMNRINMYQTTAHEIGHNLNAGHPVASNCECGLNTASLMCQNLKDPNLWFCPQSISEIASFLQSNHSKLAGICGPIGPSNPVCSDGSSFELINPSTGIVTWTVTGPFSFSSTANLTIKDGNPVTVYRTGTGTANGLLSVMTGGNIIAVASITPCPPPPTITGPAEVCYDGSTFTLSNMPAGTITWSVTGPFTVSSNGTTATVTKTGTDTNSGTLTAKVNGSEVATKTITPCFPVITGPDEICLSGGTFTLVNPPAGAFSWSVSGPFSIVVNPNNPASVRVISSNFTGQTGTLSVSLNNQVLLTKSIHFCTVGLDISGPSHVCCEYRPYVLNMPLPAGYTVSWSTSNNMTGVFYSSYYVRASTDNYEEDTTIESVYRAYASAEEYEYDSDSYPSAQGTVTATIRYNNQVCAVVNKQVSVQQPPTAITMSVVDRWSANGVVRILLKAGDQNGLQWIPCGDSMTGYPFLQWSSNYGSIVSIVGDIPYDPYIPDIGEDTTEPDGQDSTGVPDPIGFRSGDTTDGPPDDNEPAVPYDPFYAVLTVSPSNSPPLYEEIEITCTFNGCFSLSASLSYQYWYVVPHASNSSSHSEVENGILVYPNPASSTLHVEIDPSKKANGAAGNTVRQAGGTCEVQMVAVQTGALVVRQRVKDFDTSFDLDLTTVPDGLYLLRMVQNGQTVHTKNILVQH